MEENKDAVTDTTSWVDNLITKLDGATNGILTAKIGDETVEAFLGEQVIQFFKTNKRLLISLGRDAFRNFLLLINENKEEEAFNLLVEKMEADAIIARMRMNAAQLKEYNDHRDAFHAALKKFALDTLTKLAQKLLIGLLL
jgi:hypothetical protein